MSSTAYLEAKVAEAKDDVVAASRAVKHQATADRGLHQNADGRTTSRIFAWSVPREAMNNLGDALNALRVAEEALETHLENTKGPA